MTISGIPEGTKSLALIMDDPDAMGAVGKVWVHWVVWNIIPPHTDNSRYMMRQPTRLNAEGMTDFGELDMVDLHLLTKDTHMSSNFTH